MAAYGFPIIVVGWFVDAIEKKYGKAKTSYTSIFLGSLVLLMFAFLQNKPVILFLSVLLFSTFSAISVVSTKGIFADSIVINPDDEGELEAMGDMSVNIGYVIGPSLAGILSDILGNVQSFSVLGVIGVLVSLFLVRSGFKATSKLS